MKRFFFAFLVLLAFGLGAYAVPTKESQGKNIQKSSTGFPGIKVDLVSCQRYGSNVRIDFKMRNVSNGQSSFVVYGTSQNIPEHKSAFIDDQGSAHKGQVKVMNNDWSSVAQQVSVPGGIAVNGSVMLEDVPKSAKSIALFDLRGSNIGLEDDFYQVTGRDIPITPYPQDGSNGLEYCDLPLLKLDYKLCEWKNKMVHIRFTLTNVSERPLPCLIGHSRAIAYDADGYTYSKCALTLNGGDFDRVEEFSPNVPVVCDAYLQDVPTTVNFLQQFSMNFPYEDWRQSIALLNMSIAPEPVKASPKTAPRKTSVRKSTAVSRRR